MTKFKLLIIAVSIIIPQISIANPWKELALGDLKKIQKIISKNHPGPLDKNNKWFGEWYKSGYREAVSLAKKAESYQGYYYSLKYFVNGFKDGHLHYWTSLEMNRAEWPGFVIAKRGKTYVVHHVSTNKGFKLLPKKGSELHSCDGVSIDQLMIKNVFPFVGNRDLATHWIKHTPMLLFDYGNPNTFAQ
jgi:hypothetical protein